MKSKSDWKFEIKVGAFATAAAIVYFALTYTIKAKGMLKGVSYNSISPQLLPRIIGILSIVVALSILIPAIINYIKSPEASENEQIEKRPEFLTKDRVLILLAMVAYLLVIQYAGYIISTFLLAFGILLYLDKAQLKRNLIFSILFPVVCFCIFNYVLQIWLPVGIIFGGR